MKEIIIPIGLFVVITLLVTLGGLKLSEMSCRNNTQEMGKEYRYDNINGCRIGLDDGTFIYWKMYREFNK